MVMQSNSSSSANRVAGRALAAYEAAPPVRRQRLVSRLVARAYGAASPRLKASMLYHLIRPLGVLSLVTVAGGLFARVRFRADWAGLRDGSSGAPSVGSSEMIALVDQVQQVSVDALQELARQLASSPAMAGSAIVVALVAVLMHSRNHLPRDDEP